MKETTVKKIEGESFVVRNEGGFGWGVITIDETTGLFMAYTDFGTFSYHWNAPGDAGLKKFLGKLDYSYAMGKFRGRNYGRVFNHEKSILEAKKRLFEIRRERACSAETAREVYNTLEEMDHMHRAEDFIRYLADDKTCRKVFCGDEWPYEVLNAFECETNDPQCVGFWNEIYIPFVASYMPDHSLSCVEAA